jgi:hypothetical protein
VTSRDSAPIWQSISGQPVSDDERIAAMESALAGRADLHAPKYGQNARLLFAAELILDIADIHSVAAEALIDGGDDKSCDFLYVDRDAGLIVLAQGYEATDVRKSCVRQRKAANLHQAATWVFVHDIAEVPPRITPAVEEARLALAEGAIGEVRIWLVHNLPESKRIGDELAAVEALVAKVVTDRDDGIEVRAEEIGRNQLAARYHTSPLPILVSGVFSVPGEPHPVPPGPTWTAYSVTVPASWLQGVYWEYGERLFAANVRGFLGKRKKINAGIRDTLARNPEDFWIYNNGVTALVYDANYDAAAKGLLIRGISIVNGAQTTGALGGFDAQRLADATVQMRFIVCTDRAKIRDIIRYTNRQNPTEPADFRSNDAVQRRLVMEFEAMGVSGYTGGRRDGHAARLKDLDVETTSAARALAAFHGEPGIAHRAARLIWEDDALYGWLFSDATTAVHILFCWGLLRSVEGYKRRLSAAAEPMTRGKKLQQEFFNRSGSIPLLVAAIGDCLEELLDRPVPHSFRLAFRAPLPVADTIAAWEPVVDKLAPLACAELCRALDAGPLSHGFDSKESLRGWRLRVESMASDWQDLRADLREQIEGWR